MSSKNITFIVFTYNEEKRLCYVIRNFIKYGEILVVDGGSTDKTEELARKMGAKFIIRPETPPFAETQEMYNLIKPHIKTDWVFWGYVDNLMPKTLLEKLTEISQQNKIKYVKIPIYTYLWGYTKYPVEKGYSPRFFMKDYIDFSDNKIHGMGKFLGNKDEILILPNKKEYAIYHYSTYDLEKFIMNHLRYAKEEAKQRYEEGQKFSLFRTLGSMARYFILYNKNILKIGKLSILVGLSYSFFRFMNFFKLYELENNINLDSIEKNYSEEKEKLLREIE